MNAMVGTDAQKRQFSDRIGRIKAGGENTTQHIYIGPVDEAVAGQKPSKKSKPGKLRRRKKLPPPVTFGQIIAEFFLVPMAVLLGAFCILAGKMFEFHIFNERMESDLTAMVPFFGPYTSYVDLVCAVGLVLILARSTKLGVGPRARAVFAGFVAMLLFENAAVVNYPEVFAKIYPADYVADVVARLSAA